MAVLYGEIVTLQANAAKLKKLTDRVNGIYGRLSRTRAALDWDVMGEERLESRISHLLDKLNSISESVSNAGIILQDIGNEYKAANNDLEKLVSMLPVTAGQPGLFTAEGSGLVFGKAAQGYIGVTGPGYEATGEVSLDIENFSEGYIGAEGKLEGYLMKGEAYGEVGLLSGEATVTIGGASVSGNVKCELFDDGEWDFEFEAEAVAEAYVAKGEASVRFGTEDNNAYVAGEGYVCVAEARGEIEIDEDGFEVKGEVGAAVLKGEARWGFTLFGIKVEATAEGEVLGVGAGAGFKIESNSMELFGKLSAILGAGLKLKISW